MYEALAFTPVLVDVIKLGKKRKNTIFALDAKKHTPIEIDLYRVLHPNLLVH